MNAVPLADEVQRDGLVDQGAAVGVDGDGVLKVGDAPGLGEEREVARAKMVASEEQERRELPEQRIDLGRRSTVAESRSFEARWRSGSVG